MSERIKSLKVLYETELGDFTIDVRAITRDELEKLGRKHRKKGTKEPEINPKTYYPALYEHIVLNWSGLTEELKSLIMYETLNGEDPNKEVPFDVFLCTKMARTNHKFAEFIESAALNFETLLAHEIKAKRDAEELAKEIKN